MYQTFIDTFNEFGAQVEQRSKDSGFWEGDDVNDFRKISLMHAELSELVEGLRDGNPPDKHCPDFSSAEIELADVIIRAVEYSQHKKFRLAEAILAKHKFNGTRGFKHGRQF